MTLSPPLLEFRAISRRFGALRALDEVGFSIAAGEVLALLGENGAGKSTLVHVLYGLLAPDSGTILIAGAPVAIRSPRDARRLGIGMVHQHFALAPGLTVAENFVLDEGGWALVRHRRREAERRVARLAAEVGLEIDPAARVAELSVGDRQRAEILKALKGDVRLLVLDEPTATLTPRESEDLLKIVRRLRESGRSCLFISHKLDEVRAIAERVVVLRAGRVVAERALGAASNAELAELMVGERLAPPPPRAGEAAGAVRLEAREIQAAAARGGRPAARGGRPAVDGASFVVSGGEIVAITGVDGNGQGELARVLAGLAEPDAGELRVDGQPAAGIGPRGLARRGLAFVPGDRRHEGLVEGLTVAENLALKHLGRPGFGRVGLDLAAVAAFARERIARFGVRPADPAADAGLLSGGNQQRVVLARELAFEPGIVVAENPTRGLDVAAAAFVLGELARARARGAAVLMLSTELDDVLAVADRVLVMFRGRLTETASREPRVLGLLMAGAGA